jgi:murein DD-endopeptidase MepM/ murein hydrolase activator NlpD
MKENKKTFKELYFSSGRMRRFSNKNRSNGGFKGFLLIMSVAVIIIGSGYLIYKLFFIPPPVIEGMGGFQFLPAEKEVKLRGRNLKSLDISIHQGDKSIELLRDMPELSEKSYALQIKPKSLDLTDGKAIVTVRARAGLLKEVKHDISVIIDTLPPTLEVLKSPFQLYQGTGGFAVLRAKGADSVFLKLKDPSGSTGDYIFKAFKAPAGPDEASLSDLNEAGLSRKGGSSYFVFFPVPYDLKEGSVFYSVASDTAGNQNVRTLSTRLKTKKYTRSSINISDSFINSVVLPLLMNESTTSDHTGAFKKANEDLRQSNLQSLIDISQMTAPEILWEGRFLQLKNSQVMSKYGDRRDYLYNGEKISNSVHLGYDLASVENAPVEAANSGVVIYADDLGIYGNTVIIDHGMGLMSLYGHLSTMMVEKGWQVNKGDLIAKTGSTGLAGGDHLHFGILIHGYEVSPLHWWDPKWVRVNVMELIE